VTQDPAVRLAALAATSPDREDLLAGAQVRTQRALSAAARSRAAERRPTPRTRWTVRPRIAVAAAGILVLVGAAVLWRIWPAPEPPVVVSTASATQEGSSVENPTAAGSGAADVIVHVVGQVARPGVVSLPAGARVMDAVDAAGGASADADLAGLNLARVLTDGEQVVVPGPGDAAEGLAQAPGVDLNRADAAALDALPGIGPVLAERIVSWRSAHGRFTTVDELAEVAGIGPALMAGLRDLVRV
jgi:competence protein ComEA